MKDLTLLLRVTIQDDVDPDAVASALDHLLTTAISTDGVLADAQIESVGEFEVGGLVHDRPAGPAGAPTLPVAAQEAFDRLQNSEASGYNHDDLYGRGDQTKCLVTLGRHLLRELQRRGHP